MSRPLRDVLNESNPNKLPSGAQTLRLGDALALVTLFASGTVTSDVLSLPESEKAGQITRAFARVGGSTGYKTVVAPETTPAAGECAITPSGDVLFAAADAVTSAEVMYAPVEGEVFEDVVDAAASAAAFVQGRRALALLSAEVITGAIPGTKTPAARGSAPAAGTAALSAAGTGVAFNAADVVAGSVRLRYLAVPGVGSGPQPSIAQALASQVGF